MKQIMKDSISLLIDLRGCGMSEGKYTGLGWNEHYDIISWINYLVNMDASAQIVLIRHQPWRGSSDECSRRLYSVQCEVCN
jgi:alpha/beta superfamily hydrolase